MVSTAAFCVAVSALVVAAAGTAGLLVALFSLDRLYLRVCSTTGTRSERSQARELLRLLKSQHWTLVALILVNSFFMMSLPIVLETKLDQLASLAISITAVLFVGEVIPLAVFVRWAMPLCALLSPIIWAAVVVTAPISYPVGLMMDRILGQHNDLLDREELAAIICAPVVARSDSGPDGGATTEADDDENSNSGSSNSNNNSHNGKTPRGNELSGLEVRLLEGAFRLSTDTVGTHLRSAEPSVFMLSSLDVLDEPTLLRIFESGYSRIPVYFGDDRLHIIGALIVDSLAKLAYSNPSQPPSVGDYPLREVIRISENATLHEAYLGFRDGSSCMAVVYSAHGIMTGILTLTDLLSAMYHANPDHRQPAPQLPPPPPQPKQQQQQQQPQSPAGGGDRRRERMVEVMKGVKRMQREAQSPIMGDPPSGADTYLHRSFSPPRRSA